MKVTHMKNKITIDGQQLRAMFSAGADWLERIVPDINSLNVYPVPDGDCGTNMLLTIRASLAEAAKLEDASAAVVAQAIARGALMGARGNSGVILSQMWRGLAKEMEDRKTIDAKSLANALQEAADMAYSSLSNPTEGTILTVMRDAALAARQEATRSEASSITVLAAAVNAARASVMNTPNLLAVLKDAGVVDAGGHGLYTFLEGALLYLEGNGNNRSPELLSVRIAVTGIAPASPQAGTYGFCTQFIVKGAGLNVTNLRRALQNSGESLIVVGDASTIRVHIHTHDPDAVTAMASSFGMLSDIDIHNMDEQHKDFLIMNRGRMSNMPVAVVAVVNGDGLVNVFADLGVAAVVPAGQTMNPSTTDIIQTVEQVPSNNIVLLPNNKNIIPAASLAQQLTQKNIRVIPTETIPQGISALIAFVPGSDFETTATAMEEAIATVKTIEITRATRTCKIESLDIVEGQFIGLLDGELLSTGDKAENAIFGLLARLDLGNLHIVTLYFGKDAPEEEAKQIGAQICERYPDLDVGVMAGGQPNYHYIISVE